MHSSRQRHDALVPQFGIAVLMFIALNAGCATLSPGQRPVELQQCRHWTVLASNAYERGDMVGAEDHLRKALQANPADINARRLFAETLWRRGAREAAVAQMTALANVVTQDAELIARCSEMLRDSGQLDQARVRAEQAIDSNPHSSRAWLVRGTIHRRGGDLESATSDLHRALLCDATNNAAQMELAGTYYQSGQPRRCLTTLQSLLTSEGPLEGPLDAVRLQARCYLALNRPHDAALDLHAICSTAGATADDLYLLAKSQAMVGRYAVANSTALRAVAANPSHAASLQLLAQLKDGVDNLTVVK